MCNNYVKKVLHNVSTEGEKENFSKTHGILIKVTTKTSFPWHFLGNNTATVIAENKRLGHGTPVRKKKAKKDL